MLSGMNIVDIIILLILGLSLVAGMYKGFLASMLALAAFVGTWFGAMNTYGYLAGALSSNSGIMDSLSSVFNTTSIFTTRAVAGAKVATASAETLASALADVKIPLISDAFKANVTSKAFEGLGLSTFSEYLTQTLLTSIINVVSFVVMFAVIYFAALLVVNLLSSVFRFPGLRHLDWLLGGALGLARGAAILFLLFAILPMATGALASMEIPMLDELIANSRFAGYFGEGSLLAPIFSNLIDGLI